MISLDDDSQETSMLGLTTLTDVAARFRKRSDNDRNPFDDISTSKCLEREYGGHPAYHELTRWFKFAIGVEIVAPSFNLVKALESIDELDILAWIAYSHSHTPANLQTCTMAENERVKYANHFTARTARKLAWTVQYNRDASNTALGRFGRACRPLDLPKDRILDYLNNRPLGVVPGEVLRDLRIACAYWKKFKLPAAMQEVSVAEPSVTEPPVTHPDTVNARPERPWTAFFKQRFPKDTTNSLLQTEEEKEQKK
jgi:hypothetical protein